MCVLMQKEREKEKVLTKEAGSMKEEADQGFVWKN